MPRRRHARRRQSQNAPKRVTDECWDDYVDHPRYGRGPQYTGLNPGLRDAGVHLHWNSLSGRETAELWREAFGSEHPLFRDTLPPIRIPDTAIAADTDRQVASYSAVTHYFDLRRCCRGCGRKFIFFAAEQRYWYEHLQLPLEADCVHCTDCRRERRQIAHQRRRYEALCRVPARSREEDLEMADLCLSLIEAGIFTVKKLQRVRTLVNAADRANDAPAPGSGELRERVRRLDAEMS